MKILAPAKVNLFLRIGRVRPNGYHNLETIFQTISLADEITATPAKNITLKAFGPQIPKNFPVEADNIVWRAAQDFFKAFGIRSGLKISLKKNIPVQAGLGGGSSDAAAVLKICSNLFLKEKSPYKIKKIRDIACALGADVPFFLLGGCAMAKGIGEKLTPLPSQRFKAVVVKPKTGLSTREVYGWFDQSQHGFQTLTPEPQIRKIYQHLRLRKTSKVWGECIYNSFHDIVVRRVPEIEEVQDSLLTAGCTSVLLSGSGSAIFGIVKDQAQGKNIEKTLRRLKLKAWAVESVPG